MRTSKIKKSMENNQIINEETIIKNPITIWYQKPLRLVDFKNAKKIERIVKNTTIKFIEQCPEYFEEVINESILNKNKVLFYYLNCYILTPEIYEEGDFIQPIKVTFELNKWWKNTLEEIMEQLISEEKYELCILIKKALDAYSNNNQ